MLSLYFELKDKFNILEEDLLFEKFINNYVVIKYEVEVLFSESGILYIILCFRVLIGWGDIIIMFWFIWVYDEGRF